MSRIHLLLTLKAIGFSLDEMTRLSTEDVVDIYALHTEGERAIQEREWSPEEQAGKNNLFASR